MSKKNPEQLKECFHDNLSAAFSYLLVETVMVEYLK